MNFVSIKYILIICIFTALFLKLSNAISYIKFTAELEYASVDDDATEKEEKKIETEYFTDQFSFQPLLSLYFIIGKKVIIPDHNFQPTYFPEILTPPPLA